MAKFDDAEFKRLLLEKRESLQALIETTEESSAPVELDQQVQGRLSRMDALQGQAMAKENQRRREIELQKIEAALKRLEMGDFGYCLSCDEEIAEKRLKFDPAAMICISCAAKGNS